MIRDDISITDYHDSDFVSHSKVEDFVKLGPKGYWGRHLSKNAPKAQTAAMVRGNQFEDFLMGWEPEVIPDELPDARGTVKPRDADSVVVKRYMEEHPSAVTAATLDRYKRMRDAIMDNATAKSLLEGARAQLTIRCDFPGLPGIQTRPDFFVEDFGCYDLNLKTVDSLAVFRRQIRSFGYNKQAGLARYVMRQNGLEPEMYWLVAEVQYPHRALLYRPTEDTIATGESWCLRKLREMAEHYESDHWPLTVNDVEDIHEPVFGEPLEGE